eukprot:3811242-Rhodomonas_salina.2
MEFVVGSNALVDQSAYGSLNPSSFLADSSRASMTFTRRICPADQAKSRHEKVSPPGRGDTNTRWRRYIRGIVAFNLFRFPSLQL